MPDQNAPPQTNTALARKTPEQVHMETLRGLFEKAKPSMDAVIPKHLSSEKLTKIALVAVSKTPLLMKCSPPSILQSVMTAAQLGLDCGGVLGSAYLVPFKKNYKDENGNWQSRYEAQLIVGYRGFIDLARRSGQIDTIEAHPVYEGEEFVVEFGLNPILVHKPKWDRPSGQKPKMVLVYAVCRLKDGSVQVEVMSRAEVDGIRDRSKAKDDGPWISDYEEMARKTVVRRICKYLPLSPELVEAMQLDSDRLETDLGDIEVVPEDAPIEPPKRLSESKEPEAAPASAPAAAAPAAAPEAKKPDEILPPSQNPGLEQELLRAEEPKAATGGRGRR